MVYRELLYPFGFHREVYSTFDQNFDFEIRRDHQKNSCERRSAASMSRLLLTLSAYFWLYLISLRIALLRNQIDI